MFAFEYANLRRTRDLLLSRLVSGEIAVHEWSTNARI
jgi:hypothetical protein